MIDFIKLNWKDKSRIQPYTLTEGNFDEVKMVLEKHSGQIRHPYTSEFAGMKLGLTEKSAYVKNSIHKSYNILKTGIEHNANDFTYSNLCEQIDYFSLRLTDLEGSRITQLEFGLNIHIEVPAEILIRRNILMHKLKGANHNRKYFGRGELKQFDYHNYVFKVYDKAKQYMLDCNIIRFEVKFIRSKGFQELGVFKLLDLKDKTKLRKLFLALIERFDELTIVDDYEENWFTVRELNMLKRYVNPAYWEEDLRARTRQTKLRHKNKFESILNKYDLLKTKSALRGLLYQKFIYLINN